MPSDETVAIEAHILDNPETREAERKYIWKLDLIVLPTISALYFFEYIDRGNIAVKNFESLRTAINLMRKPHRMQSCTDSTPVMILQDREWDLGRSRLRPLNGNFLL